MPEGHSIHRLARQFTDVFAGAVLAVSSPQGKFTAGAALLDGHTLLRAEAHGKQLFMTFGHARVLRVHLGLYGAWDFGGDDTFAGASSIGAPRRIGERELPATPTTAAAATTAATTAAGAAATSATAATPAAAYAGPSPPVGAVRVRLVSAHGWADLRGPTACEVLTAAEAAAVRASLGPDPLGHDPLAGAEFARRLRRSRTSVALQLMKQDVIAGVGNVYRAELLFRLGLDPQLPGSGLSSRQAQELWVAAGAALRDGVRDGRIITTDLADRPTGLGVDVGLAAANTPPAPNREVPTAEAHYVYKREQLPCRRCGTPIALAELGGRKLYWCPSCQAR